MYSHREPRERDIRRTPFFSVPMVSKKQLGTRSGVRVSVCRRVSRRVWRDLRERVEGTPVAADADELAYLSSLRGSALESPRSASRSRFLLCAE
eukprot:3308345-Prymnesium_polylepis.2